MSTGVLPMPSPWKAGGKVEIGLVGGGAGKLGGAGGGVCCATGGGVGSARGGRGVDIVGVGTVGGAGGCS